MSDVTRNWFRIGIHPCSLYRGKRRQYTRLNGHKPCYARILFYLLITELYNLISINIKEMNILNVEEKHNIITINKLFLRC